MKIRFTMALLAGALSCISSAKASEINEANDLADAKPILAESQGSGTSNQQSSESNPGLNPSGSMEVMRINGIYIQGIFSPYQTRGDACDDIGCSDFDAGVSGSVAVGYQKGDFRFELEYMNYKNDFSSSTFAQDFPAPCNIFCTAAAGETQSSVGTASVQGNAFMLNAYYDIPLSKRIRPYIGGGIGTYNGKIKDLNLPAFSNLLGDSVDGESDYRFAAQFRAGIGLAVTSQLNAFIGYRYFKGADYNYSLEANGQNIGTIEPNGLSSSALELGFRWVFK